MMTQTMMTRGDDGWCRDDNDVKDNCDSGCSHCARNIKGDERKDEDLCKVPYFNYYYCANYVSNVEGVTFFQRQINL